MYVHINRGLWCYITRTENSLNVVQFTLWKTKGWIWVIKTVFEIKKATEVHLKHILCSSLVVIPSVLLLHVHYYCLNFWVLNSSSRMIQLVKSKMPATMQCRDSFESMLISKASLFTFLTAAGQINRLESKESLYTYKEAGPVGRAFGRKLWKLLLSTL